MTEQDRINKINCVGGLHLKTFKSENITYAMCLAAVKKTGAALEFVPDQFLTDEIYIEACKQDGAMLCHLPDELMTPELCVQAIVSNPQAMKYAPVEYISPECISEAAKKGGYTTSIINSLPKELKKASFYNELVSIDPEFIWYIPQSSLTAKIGKVACASMGFPSVAEAVKARPRLLRCLHTSLYCHEVCLNFINSEYFKDTVCKHYGGTSLNGYLRCHDNENYNLAIRYACYVPAMMHWKDVSIPLLRRDGNLIKYVDENIIDEDVYVAAIPSDAKIINTVPTHLRTETLYLSAFANNPRVIEFMPDKYISEDMAIQAVECEGRLIHYLPNRLKTKNVCLIAAMNGHIDLADIPAEILDKETCLAWISKCPVNLYNYDPLFEIPEKLRDYDVCIAAVSKNGSDLKFVPKDIIDENMCIVALKSSHAAAPFIPKDLFTVEMAKIIVQGEILSCGYFRCIPENLLTEEMCICAIKNDYLKMRMFFWTYIFYVRPINNSSSSNSSIYDLIGIDGRSELANE